MHAAIIDRNLSMPWGRLAFYECRAGSPSHQARVSVYCTETVQLDTSAARTTSSNFMQLPRFRQNYFHASPMMNRLHCDFPPKGALSRWLQHDESSLQATAAVPICLSYHIFSCCGL